MLQIGNMDKPSVYKLLQRIVRTMLRNRNIATSGLCHCVIMSYIELADGSRISCCDPST